MTLRDFLTVVPPFARVEVLSSSDLAILYSGFAFSVPAGFVNFPLDKVCSSSLAYCALYCFISDS